MCVFQCATMPSVHRRVYWLGLAPTYYDFSFLRRLFLPQGKAERLDLNDMSIKKDASNKDH